MADINLLGNTNKPKFSFGQNGASLGVKILVGLLLLVILYYVYLRYETSHAETAVLAVQAQTSQLEADALNRKDRGEVVTRQGQVQVLNALIKSHVYWSGLFPELARVTLKSASYAGFTANTNGTLDLDVLVPDYVEADKYIQVFDLPQFNQEFSDVKVLSISKTQIGNNVATEMKLQLKYDPQFIRKTLE